MTAYSGYVRGVNLLSGSRSTGARKVYELAIDTTTTLANSDTVVITGVPARIQENRKNGKTFNYIGAIGGQPVVDISGNPCYCSLTITNSSGTLTIQVCQPDPTCAATAAGQLNGLGLLVVGYES